MSTIIWSYFTFVGVLVTILVLLALAGWLLSHITPNHAAGCKNPKCTGCSPGPS